MPAGTVSGRRPEASRRRAAGADPGPGASFSPSSPAAASPPPCCRPGKLNNTYWESRVRSEHGLGAGPGVPPRTPPPRRRLMEVNINSNNNSNSTTPDSGCG